MQKKVTPIKILFIFILLNLVIGMWIVPNFGRTPDEVFEYLRTTSALKAYSPSSLGKYSDNDIPVVARFYGTAMTMIAQFAENIFQPHLQSESGVIVHYFYFIFFQLAVLAIFFLGKKFTSEWTALIVSLLFGTQPLYFGHAFINPKDTPLMSIFLIAITVGIYMADQFLAHVNNDPKHEIKVLPTLNPLSAERKKRLISIQVIWLVMLSSFLLVTTLVPSIIEKLYHADIGTFWGTLFTYIASPENRGALPSYIEKATVLTNRAFLGTTILVAILMLIIGIRTIPAWKSQFNSYWLIPIKQSLNLRYLATILSNLNLIAAGFLWGWAIATRVVGIFAGGIVGVYFLIRGRGRVVLPAVIYTIVAALTAFLAFPQLWHAGFTKTAQGLSLFSSFVWDNQVLYQGNIYSASELPRSYLPFFLLTQFTEPVVLIGSVGFLIGIFLAIKRKSRNLALFLVICLWFFLPIAYVLIKHPALYNNCRQFLFITPPLFIFAAIALEAILNRINHIPWQSILSLAILIPGLIAIFQLHPYEYIYYNTFVGGVEGAFRTYETDYWSLSTTEAIKEINRIAPLEAKVILWAPTANIITSIRPDLLFISQKDITRDISYYDYALITSQFNADLFNLTDRPAIYTIARGDVILAVVKAISTQE